MKRLKVAVIGTGAEGNSICELLIKEPYIEIAGLAGISGELSGITSVQENNIVMFQTLEELISIDGLDIVFETTGNPEISKKLHELRNSNFQIVESSCLHLVKSLINHNKTADARLQSLVQSVDDAVQIVDKDGFITHINMSFINISGMSYQELVGHNIHDIMPDSPTAKSVCQKRPISGDKYRFNGSSTEVSYHVSPVFNNELYCGSLAVYREVTDVKRLMNELKSSRNIIEDIYERLTQSENFTGLVDFDVVPIDHMEQTLLKHALTKFGYSVEGKKLAAKALNISLATLYNKLKKYQIS